MRPFLQFLFSLTLVAFLGGCASQGVTNSSFTNLEGTGEDPCPWGTTVMDTSMDEALAIIQSAMDELYPGKKIEFNEQSVSYSIEPYAKHKLSVEPFLVKNLEKEGPAFGITYKVIAHTLHLTVEGHKGDFIKEAENQIRRRNIQIYKFCEDEVLDTKGNPDVSPTTIPFNKADYITYIDYR